MTEELSSYHSRGARALVLLHDKHMRQCLDTWKQAKAANVKLSDTTSEHYRSLETLLQHMFHAAANYMVWTCRQLKLADPNFRPLPEADAIEAEAESYLEHLLERWRLPLVDLAEDALYQPEYEANNGSHHLCIDIMLEHAVMHPIRHRFQLEELLAARSSARNQGRP